MCDAAVRLIKAADYTNAGTVEFIVDKHGQLLLHRGQRPHPGRAPGDGDGHRHRPDQVADPRRRRRAAAVYAGRHRAPRRGDRVPHQRRRPEAEFPAVAGQDRAADRAGRLRRAVRLARPQRLRRAAVLRFDDRQADRPSADARAKRSPACSGPWPSCASRASRRRCRCTRKSSATRRSSKAASTPRSSNGR